MIREYQHQPCSLLLKGRARAFCLHPLYGRQLYWTVPAANGRDGPWRALKLQITVDGLPVVWEWEWGEWRRVRGGQTTAFMIPWPSLITPPDSWLLLYCLWYLHCCRRYVLIDGLFMESICIECDNLGKLNVVLSDA